jgi:uncharacterized protein (DUF488 family)
VTDRGFTGTTRAARAAAGFNGTRVRIYTIGHSTQDLGAFLEALGAHAIQHVWDVRRFPGSRRHPHFSGPALAASLAAAGIAYTHAVDLGGRRPARKDSPNTAWRNAAFRGYADYMDTPEFERALAHLVEAAGRERLAVMCAERLWWQCHRGLIADALKCRGHDVTHILSASTAEPHPYTSAARIVNGQLSYKGLL